MATSVQTQTAESVDLRELADQLRHDLARYVAFQTRCLEPDSPESLLVEVLSDDLLRTRRQGEQVVDIAQVWAPIELALDRAGLAELPWASALRATMTEVVALSRALRAGQLSGQALRRAPARVLSAADLAREAAVNLRDLVEREHG